MSCSIHGPMFRLYVREPPQVPLKYKTTQTTTKRNYHIINTCIVPVMDGPPSPLRTHACLRRSSNRGTYGIANVYGSSSSTSHNTRASVSECAKHAICSKYVPNPKAENNQPSDQEVSTAFLWMTFPAPLIIYQWSLHKLLSFQRSHTFPLQDNPWLEQFGLKLRYVWAKLVRCYVIRPALSLSAACQLV